MYTERIGSSLYLGIIAAVGKGILEYFSGQIVLKFRTINTKNQVKNILRLFWLAVGCQASDFPLITIRFVFQYPGYKVIEKTDTMITLPMVNRGFKGIFVYY